MNKKDNICFLIITYNAENFLDRLFDSINKEYGIFVVDNGSGDNTIQLLIEKKISYIVNKENGYASGINKGLRIIREMGYDYAFALNQDTEILDFNFDYELLTKYAVVQPLVLNEDLTVGVDELKMNIYGFVFPYRYKKKVINESKELMFFSGAGFIININKYFEIGDFDENYFMYYEDIDFAVKCFLAGEKIFLTDGIKIIHFYKNSVSSLKKIKMLLKSRRIFINKYFVNSWRLFLFARDFRNSGKKVSKEDKIKFFWFIFKRTLLGFNTRQIPFLIMHVFNLFAFPYGLFIKIIIPLFLSTEKGKR